MRSLFTFRALQWAGWFWGLAAISSCAAYQGPGSVYQEHYESELGSLSIPSHEEIQELGPSYGRATYLHTPTRVWDACILIARQSRGILRVHAPLGSSGPRQLVFISGKPREFASRKGRVSKLVDRWIAISVSSTGSTTEVVGAPISPETLQPCETDLTWESDDESLSISQVVITEFMDQVHAVLASEEDWLRKFRPSTYKPPIPRVTSIPLRESIDVVEAGDLSELSRTHGNFISAEMRRGRVVLNCPQIENHIGEIVTNIRAAAGRQDQEVGVFVLAPHRFVTPTGAHEVPANASVSPNGDVFLESRLLDELQTNAELAAVIAHELDHVFQQDAIRRTQKAFQAATPGVALSTSLVLVGAFASGMFDTSVSAAPADTLFTLEESLVAGGLMAGAMLLGGKVGELIGTGIGQNLITTFSQDQETRADLHSAEYLWRAGYAYGGMRTFLSRRLEADRIGDEVMLNNR